MRRRLLLLMTALLGWAAAAAVRHLVASRPAGTPSAWPAVPRRDGVQAGSPR